MCGIIGYCGHRNAAEVLIDGLKKLEYRGYDSAGIAVIGGELTVHKNKGEISDLERSLPPLPGHVGIGHTRWATCGKPSRENAHPFTDCSGRLALVHNGIIENHLSLRERLEAEGHRFTSGTDTEVLVHLVEKHYDGDLRRALIDALVEVKGSYAVVVMANGSDRLVAARRENPLVVGLSVGENFLASDVTPLLSYTNKVIYLHDDECVEVTPTKVTLYGADGVEIEREPSVVTWSVEDAQKSGFEHFMLKEIYEQPSAIHNTLLGFLDEMEGPFLRDQRYSQVKIIACGSSYHAGMVGKYLIEDLAKVTVGVELASEYRYSAAASESPLTIFISQSGETADTLAALREARRRGCYTMAVTNVVGSSMTREANEVHYTRAGPEIGVAATKTFLTQLVMLALIAMRMGRFQGTLNDDACRSLRSELRVLPHYVQGVLDRAGEIEAATDMLVDARDVFFIGRNINYPVMLEGALKLKEISYIHAEGNAAGELKHGPLALIDSTTPVVACCVRDHTYEKMMTNIAEVAARGSPVLAIGFEGDVELEKIADRTLSVPKLPPLLSPIPVSVVLQLLAYHTARRRGHSIDKPRNLAKSVTVE